MNLCKPLHEERGNVVPGRLYDDIERIHKEGGGEKDEEGLKRDDDGGNDAGGGGVGEGEGCIPGGRLQQRQDIRRHCLQRYYYY